jgi:hypothetical protein
VTTEHVDFPEPLPGEAIEKLRGIVEAHGVDRVAVAVGIHGQTLLRAMAGLRLRAVHRERISAWVKERAA